MKKSLLLFISLLSFSLGACGSTPESQPSLEPQPSSQITSEQTSSTQEQSTSQQISSRDEVNEQIHQIYLLYISNGGAQTYEEWLASIKGEKGEPGKDGKDGVDGKTPFIGTNGNWWIGTDDTNVKAFINQEIIEFDTPYYKYQPSGNNYINTSGSCIIFKRDGTTEEILSNSETICHYYSLVNNMICVSGKLFNTSGYTYWYKKYNGFSKDEYAELFPEDISRINSFNPRTRPTSGFTPYAQAFNSYFVNFDSDSTYYSTFYITEDHAIKAGITIINNN